MPNTIWHQCLEVLKEEFPAQQFNTWLRPLQPHLQETQLELYAPNRFVMDWVQQKYLSRISEVLQEIEGHLAPSVKISVGSAPKGLGTATASQTVNGSNGIARGLDSGPTHRPAIAEEAGSVTEEEKGIAAVVPSAQTATMATRVRAQAEDDGVHQSFLNEHFIFDTFVEGKSNQLARAASMQVADNPGTAYNPLFLYGGVGLGKTHLMHAVGNEIVSRNPNAKVAYLRSERFVADMVKALQQNAISKFKRYYRSVDALLIDDIQFFARKERSQEEFFHTFNALLEGGQQVIVTCDRFPKEIADMEERLKSRFGWGLTVMVEPPELETRVAILMSKAEQSNVELSSEAAFFIAQKIRSNVRELEGALRLVIANARFRNARIDPPFIRESLKDLLALHEKQISIDNIQRTVAEYYKIKVSDLLSKRRTRTVTRPRQMAMVLSKELTSHSLPEIGEAFGGRDHTTVLHACRKIHELREEDAGIRKDYQNFMRLLTS